MVKNQIISQLSLNSGSWQLFAFQSEQELLSRVEQLVAIYILISIVALVLMLIAVRYFNLRFVKPIVSVSEGLEKLHNRAIWQAKPLKAQTKDEIGNLIRWFNRYLIETAHRKKLEESLELSKARYELAAKASNDALFEWDLVTGHMYYSPRCMELFGVESITDSEHEWLTRIVPDDVDKVQQAVNAHIDGATDLLDIEYRFQHADGVKAFRSRGLVECNDSGKPIRLAGSHRDITKEKGARVSASS